MSKNGQATIAAVREVAGEQPDTVWGKYCAYVVDAKPGCLVGQGLWRAGVIDKNFSKRHSLNAAAIDEDKMRDFLKFDQDEIHWLARGQSYQDSHGTWDESVRYADRMTTSELETAK